MTVELSPITDADIAAVADFLRVNYKDRIPWVIMAGPWKVDAPNHGFMLHDGQRIVGAHTAFYSERLVAGIAERFCDLGTWYVLPVEWREAYAAGDRDRTFVVSPESYTEGLLWPAVGAGPSGAKPLGYGMWAMAPRIEAD